MEFPEAIEELASTIGLEVQREERTPSSPFAKNTPAVKCEDKHSMYDLMDSIAKFHRQQLKVPANKHAIEYLKIVVYLKKSSRNLALDT